MVLLLKVIVFLCICDLNVVLVVFTENSLCVFFIKLKWLSLNVISFCFLKVSRSATFPLSELFVFNWWHRVLWELALWTLIQKKRSKLNLEIILASFSWLDFWWKPNLDAVGLLLVKQTVTFSCLDHYLRSFFISNKIVWKMSCGFEDVNANPLTFFWISHADFVFP